MLYASISCWEKVNWKKQPFTFMFIPSIVRLTSRKAEGLWHHDVLVLNVDEATKLKQSNVRCNLIAMRTELDRTERHPDDSGRCLSRATLVCQYALPGWTVESVESLLLKEQNRTCVGLVAPPADNIDINMALIVTSSGSE